jgi:hypothetical protein
MYRVTIETANNGTVAFDFQTEHEAWAVRDSALEAGYTKVWVEGLPTTIAGSNGYHKEMRL